MKPFAAFDLDGTLIRWQLFHAIVHSLGKHGHLPDGAHERIHQARMNWKQRTTDNGFAAYEDVLVTEYIAALKTISPAEYEVIAQDVFAEYKDQTFTYTRNLAQELKAKGYILIAISGSQQEVVDELAKHYGFDIAVGSTLEQVDGMFTGKIDTPIFDKAKVLNRLITEHNLTTDGSYAIGDSASDAPMLEIVDNPIAFNPDQKFFDIASAKGWKIVVERKNMTYQLTHQQGVYQLESNLG
ncbi:MAG TPA: HAD family phosphatase [Candidatus Saccharimonadales bacterium]|nr:HAD family phosphatase [Candidatus Saccharimonadales bacterium]